MRRLVDCLTVPLFVVVMWGGCAYANSQQTSPSQEAMATATISESTKPKDYKGELNTLLQSELYSRSYEDKRWESRHKNEQKQSDDGWFLKFLEALFGNGINGSWLGVIGKGLALLLLAAIVYLVVKNLDKFKNFVPQNLARARPVANRRLVKEQVYDMSAGLPDRQYLIAEVERCLAQGQFVVALSLLYRGTLRELLLVHELPITHSQTEVQCQNMLRQARQVHPSESKFFEMLVALWQMSAYGKRLPSDAKQKIQALSQNWQRIYLNSSHASLMNKEMS